MLIFGKTSVTINQQSIIDADYRRAIDVERPWSRAGAEGQAQKTAVLCHPALATKEKLVGLRCSFVIVVCVKMK